MSNILGYYNNEKTSVTETKDENINMPVVFVRNDNQLNQRLLIDSPNELFYNPSTKTLHADNFSGAHSNLVEGEAIKLTHDTTNHNTTIDVNFDKNTAVTTSISALDTILVQDTLDFLKTITGANLRESLKPTAGSNLSYGSGATINTLNLDNTITGLTKLTVGISPATDTETGLETYGKVIASRIDSTGIEDLLYLNNAGGVGAESGIVFRTNAYNCVTRFDETNYKIGASDAIFNGNLTEWMRINATELKVSGDCNLTSTHKYKINDVIMPYDILADNGLGLTSGVLKIDISSCVSQSTPGADDIFIYNLNIGGTSKKIKLSELITAINTDTTYLLGNNLSFDDTTSPHTINLSTTLTNMVKIVGATNLTLQTQNEQIFLTGFDGGSGGDDIIWKTNRGSGVVEMMKLEGTTNILTLQGKMDITGDYKINGNVIPETILANNGLALSAAGVLKIDIASCVGKSTITSTDLFILQIADGTSKKMTGAELLAATGGTDTTYTFTANNLQTVGTNINLNPVLTSMTSVNGQIFFDTKQLAVGEVNNTYSYLASGYSDTQGFLTCGSTSDGSRSSNGNILNGWKFLYKTSNGALEIHRNNGSTTSITALIIDRADGTITCGGALRGGLNNTGPGNFHIDNYSTAGEMYLNYYNNNNVRIGNSSVSSQASGPYTTIFSNRDTPFVINNNYNSTISAGFHCGIKQNLALDTTSMIHAFSKKGTMHHCAVVGYVTEGGSNKPLWLNCEQGGTVDWEPGGKFAPQGEACVVSEIFCGARANVGVTAGLTNDPKITVGRNLSYNYGIHLGGWTSTVLAFDAQLANSGNFHIDGSSAGDMYLNYYGQNASRDCRIFRCICTSDRRIKTNFIPINNDELLNQIENLELTTYNFKDPKFKSDENTLGFIADSLQHKSYFDGFVVVGTYNMPFDEIDQIQLDYVLKDKIITVSNYILDLTKQYYYYAYKADGTFLTIENKPLSENSFEYLFDDEFIRLVVIGEKRNDCKSIKPEKLIPGAYAGIQSLIKKNKYLENKVNELELKLGLIMQNLNISL